MEALGFRDRVTHMPLGFDATIFNVQAPQRIAETKKRLGIDRSVIEACPTTSTMDLQGNNLVFEGPFICGKLLCGPNMTMRPLPTVSNLPPGAPVPPNAPAVIGTPVITSGG